MAQIIDKFIERRLDQLKPVGFVWNIKTPAGPSVQMSKIMLGDQVWTRVFYSATNEKRHLAGDFCEKEVCEFLVSLIEANIEQGS